MSEKSKSSEVLESQSDLRSSNVVEEFGARILDFVHRSDRDGIIFYARDGDVEYANERALAMFGAKRLVGLNFFDIRDENYAALGHFPEFGPEHDDLVIGALSGKTTRGEVVAHGPEGPRELEVLYGPVQNAEGRVTGVIASYRDVTEQRQVNELMLEQNREIEQQRAMMSSVLDVLEDGVVAFDADFKVALLNPAFTQLLGLDPETDYQTLDELLAGSNLLRPEAFQNQLNRAVGRGEREQGLHLTEDEDVRCLELTVADTGLDGQQVICTLRDITDWQQVQQFQLLAAIGRLSAEHNQLDDMARLLVEIIFEKLNVDIAVLALFDRGRLRPVVWRGVMLEPEFAVDPLAHHDVREALDRGVPVESDGAEWDGGGGMTGVHYVVPLVASGNKIGTLHLGSLQSVRLFSSPGRAYADPATTFDRVDRSFLEALGGYVAVALESTRLFDSAAQSTARLKALIERIPDGVVMFNARGEILLLNEAAKEISEMDWRNLNSDSRPYRIRALDGRPLPRGDWPFFRAVRSGESIMQQELVFDFGDRRKHIEVNVVPIAGSEGQVPAFVGMLKDVTERSEQDRRKDEFLSVASHELRSPMTPLTGFIQMTRRQIEQGKMPDLNLVARAEYQVQRLSRLIDGLLDMTRIETDRMVLQRERIDLAELIHRTLDAWVSHPKEFHLELDVPVGQPVIANVDPGRIDQVLTNVVDNAVKHIDEGGEVRVSLAVEPNAAKIRVEDNGQGIPQGEIDRIFDRFYQADHAASLTGVGLGLYITSEIIAQHGGEIDIQSDPGVSTVVEITLPLEPH